MSRQNTLKGKKTDKTDFEKEKKSEEKPITRKSVFHCALLRDERSKQVFGAFLMLFSIFLAVSFVSFLFTWKTDRDKEK